MSRSIVCLGFALAITAVGPLAAQQAAETPPERPSAGVLASATAIASVQAIDMTTREVTLRKEDGEVVTLVVGEEARNLGQVEVGDRVIVHYEVGLVIALGPPGSEPTRIDDTEVVRAPAGERPAGVVRKTTFVTATVVEIDSQQRTVTLRGPQRVVELPVADDIDLSQVAVGDQVAALYEESLALLVEPVEE